MSNDMNDLIGMLSRALNPVMFGWLIGQVIVSTTMGFDLYNSIFSFCLTWAMMLFAATISMPIANMIIRKRKGQTLSNPSLSGN